MNFRSKYFFSMLFLLALIPLSQLQLNNMMSFFTETKFAQVHIDNNENILLEMQISDNSTIHSSPMIIQGTTVPNAEVFVNQKELKSDPQGIFSTSYELDEGENILVIVVNDKDGNFAEKEITVNLESVE